MKRMSFSLTTEAFRNRTKTVTRRRADTWKDLRAGDRVLGIEKGMGLKKGEKQVVLGEIEIVSVRIERLDAIFLDPQECVREGLPDLCPLEFVEMFQRTHRPIRANELVRRIEYRYVA